MCSKGCAFKGSTRKCSSGTRSNTQWGHCGTQHPGLKHFLGGLRLIALNASCQIFTEQSPQGHEPSRYRNAYWGCSYGHSSTKGCSNPCNNRKNVLSGVRQHLLVRIRRCFDVCFVLDCRRLNPRIGVLFSQSNLNGIIQLPVFLILRLRVFL